MSDLDGFHRDDLRSNITLLLVSERRQTRNCGSWGWWVLQSRQKFIRETGKDIKKARTIMSLSPLKCEKNKGQFSDIWGAICGFFCKWNEAEECTLQAYSSCITKLEKGRFNRGLGWEAINYRANWESSLIYLSLFPEDVDKAEYVVNGLGYY